MTNTYIKTHDYTARIIMLGDCCVGKTSFTKAINDPKHFNHVYDATIGVDYSSKLINLKDSTTIKCQIWDTAGQEKFISIIKCYFNNISGSIVMFDLSRRSTFNNLKLWFNEINKNTGKYPISIILVGNKTDNQYREISKKEAQEFAKQFNALYIEISVKKKKNIHKVLNMLCEDIYKNKDFNKGFKEIEGIKITKSEKDLTFIGCCCCF